MFTFNNVSPLNAHPMYHSLECFHTCRIVCAIAKGTINITICMRKIIQTKENKCDLLSFSLKMSAGVNQSQDVLTMFNKQLTVNKKNQPAFAK